MMGLIMMAEATAGTSIDIAAQELIALSAKLGCMVAGKFNGIQVLAHASYDPSAIIEQYRDELEAVRASRFPDSVDN
jgi:hypothetical protein